MKNTLAVALREVRRITGKRTIYLMTLTAPIVLFLVFGFIYSKALVREIPVAVVNKDGGNLSGMMVNNIDAASSMKVVKNVSSAAEAEDLMKRGEVDGIFMIPADFEKDLKQGRYSQVSLLINGMNLIKSNYIYNDGLKIIKTFSAALLLKKIRSGGFTKDQAMAVVNPVKTDTQILFNPNYSYTNYLVPGLTTFTLMMLVMLTAVLLISSEFVHDTFDDLLSVADHSAFAIVLGKAIPHLTLQLLNIIVLFGVIYPIFGIVLNGDVNTVIIFTFFFITVCFFLGMAISVWFKDQLQATEIALFLNTPSFIFSGLTFPLWAMPDFHRNFAMLLPYTHFLDGFVKLSQMNADISFVIRDTAYLTLFLAFALFILTAGLIRRMKEAERENLA